MVLQIENDLIRAIVGFPIPGYSSNADCRPSFSTACFPGRPDVGESLAVERLRSWDPKTPRTSWQAIL